MAVHESLVREIGHQLEDENVRNFVDFNIEICRPVRSNIKRIGSNPKLFAI